MQGLDAPVVAGQAGQACWVGAGGGQAGDAEDGDRGAWIAVEVADVAFDEGDLVDVREREIVRCGQDADGAAVDPAVATAVLGVADRNIVPGQGVERGEQFGAGFCLTQKKNSAPRRCR